MGPTSGSSDASTRERSVRVLIRSRRRRDVLQQKSRVAMRASGTWKGEHHRPAASLRVAGGYDSLTCAPAGPVGNVTPAAPWRESRAIQGCPA